MKDMQTYRVAGFRFIVEGERPQVSNLDPFITDTEEGELLFTLSVVKELPLAVTTPYFTTDDGPGFPEISIDRFEDGGWRFRVRPLPGRPVAGDLRCDKEFHHAELVLTSVDDAFALNNSLMLLFAFSSAHKGLLEMHASVVMNEGKGYLFLGKSGTGKSTHSSLWLKHIEGSELMNDDNPVLRVGEDGVTRVYGSPWSGKTPCYRKVEVPIGGIVRLEQAPKNEVAQIAGIKAYANVIASAASIRWRKDIMDALSKTAEIVVTLTPCWHLKCLPDADAALTCKQAVTAGS